MERMTVDIKVHPTVKEFILCTNNGSDIVTPEKGDWIWQLLKQHLIPAPKGIRLLTDEERKDYIRISLLDSHSSQIYARDVRRNIHINTLYRWYLDERGQNAIARHLRTQFKLTFHSFIQGATFTNPDVKLKDAIVEFCSLYNLSFNKISYDMLARSWNRSDQREASVEGKISSVIII